MRSEVDGRRQGPKFTGSRSRRDCLNPPWSRRFLHWASCFHTKLGSDVSSVLSDVNLSWIPSDVILDFNCSRDVRIRLSDGSFVGGWISVFGSIVSLAQLREEKDVPPSSRAHYYTTTLGLQSPLQLAADDEVISYTFYYFSRCLHTRPWCKHTTHNTFTFF